MPGFNPAAVVRHNPFDMVDKFAFGLGGAANILSPAWHGVVPDKRMTAHRHSVGVGEGEHAVAEVELELLAVRTQITPEQTAFRRQLLTIGFERAAVINFGIHRIGAHA